MAGAPRVLLLRLATATAVAAALGLAFGRGIVVLTLPVVDFALDILLPGCATQLSMAGTEIRLFIVTLRPLELPGDYFIPALARLGPITFSVDHQLVSLVILATGIAVWPTQSVREALLRAAAAAPLGLVVVVATLPFHLAGFVLAELSQRSWTISYMIFLEMGGRWLLPIVLAAASVRALRRATSRAQARAIAPLRSRATSSTSSRPIERARAE